MTTNEAESNRDLGHQDEEDEDPNREGLRLTAAFALAIETPHKALWVNDGAESLLDVKASLRLPRLSRGDASELLPVLLQMAPTLVSLVSGGRVSMSPAPAEPPPKSPSKEERETLLGASVVVLAEKGEHGYYPSKAAGRRGVVAAHDPQRADSWLVSFGLGGSPEGGEMWCRAEDLAVLQ